MPIPVSQISMRNLPWRRRHPTSTLPRWVYFSAFESDCGAFARADADRSELTVRRDPAQREAGRLRVIVNSTSTAEQLVDWDATRSSSGAYFNLVDVEQRIQHSRHGAQSFVDALTSFWAFSPTTFLANKP